MRREKTRKDDPIQEQALLRMLLDTLPDSIYFKDLKHRYTRINRALAAKLGVSHPSEAIGKTDFDFFSNVHAEHAREVEEEILRTGQPFVDFEEREVWPDGRETWVVTTKMPFRNEQGAVIGTFGISRDVTQHKRGEEMLRNSEALHHSLVENLPQNIFRKDLEGRLTFVNRKYCETLGMAPEQSLGKTDFDLFPEDLAKKYREDDRRVIKTGETFEDTESHQPPGKPKVVVRVVKTPILDSRGYVVGIQGMFWDVTERVRAEEALRKSEERYALAIDGANDGLWDWDLTTNEIHYSARWKEQLGCTDAEIGTDPLEWMRRVHPEDSHSLKTELNTHLAGRSAHFENEHRMRHRDRGYRWMLSRGVAVRDASGKVTRMAGSQTDITDRKRAEEELTHQAFYDSLTDLPNRVLFLDRLNQVIRRNKRKPDQKFAVLFLDLDRFKDVNDGLGHNNGDLMLTSLSRKLEACVRPGDTVARLGGDEFTILLDDLRHVDDAVQVAERIQKELSKPFNLNGHDVFASASIGIAPGGAYEKPDDMLRDADTAMYRAKERGRNCYEMFDPNMHANAVSRLQLETDLRRALERGEFRVFYQPIVSLKTDSLVGFEALVRWKHSERGMVSPGEFLPLAEENGLILPIDNWVMKEACRQTRQWQEAFPSCPPLTINVNLSSKHFSQPGLVSRVADTLKETGLDGPTLRLEITESVIMDDSPSIRKVLTELKDLNVQLYLDDFGTGYSSLGYLHRFPIDSLKIHHSFVGQLGQQSDRGELVKTITTLASNLKMGVVAEGVETEDQLARLRTLQCDRVQGFFFSRPVDAEAAEELLRKRPRWTQGRVRTA